MLYGNLTLTLYCPVPVISEHLLFGNWRHYLQGLFVFFSLYFSFHSIYLKPVQRSHKSTLYHIGNTYLPSKKTNKQKKKNKKRKKNTKKNHTNTYRKKALGKKRYRLKWVLSKGIVVSLESLCLQVISAWHRYVYNAVSNPDKLVATLAERWGSWAHEWNALQKNNNNTLLQNPNNSLLEVRLCTPCFTN